MTATTAVSLRMNAALKQEIEFAAKSSGMTKSQFMLNAILAKLEKPKAAERLAQIEKEEQALVSMPFQSYYDVHEAYDTDKARDFIRNKLKAKYGLGKHR